MAKEVCANCGTEKSVFGPLMKFTDVNGKLYCANCVEGALTSAKTESLSNMTDTEKLTKIVDYLDSLEDEAMDQSKSLRRIRNVIEIFVILFVIGIIIQSCSR